VVQRPVRSQIYLPVLRFGITDEDWGFVILASILGYAAPFLLGLKLYNIPLELVGWVFTMGVSILALNLIRRKSRPGWLKHTIQAATRGRVCRRRLPGEVAGSWIKENEE
jgi:hypothetical protein